MDIPEKVELKLGALNDLLPYCTTWQAWWPVTRTVNVTRKALGSSWCITKEGSEWMELSLRSRTPKFQEVPVKKATSGFLLHLDQNSRVLTTDHKEPLWSGPCWPNFCLQHTPLFHCASATTSLFLFLKNITLFTPQSLCWRALCPGCSSKCSHDCFLSITQVSI